MPRGRPPLSEVRQNLIEILHVLKQGYGYELYKAYLAAFPPVTMRNIYYHLKKGKELGVFKVKHISVVDGTYSWGSQAEKTYYALGPRAIPKKPERVRAALATWGRESGFVPSPPASSPAHQRQSSSR